VLSTGRLSYDHLDYYLSLASADDYYTKGGEPPGQWIGLGAEELGLSGEVEPSHLRNLFRGLSPEGERALCQIQKKEDAASHHPGWDFSFTVPKSVSTLWSQIDAPLRAELQRIQQESVQEAMSFIEKTAVFTRTGKGGHEFVPSKMIAACFEHSTSRAGDPNLHTHALIMNVGVRTDGSTGTLSGLHLFGPNLKMTAGALYRAAYAYRLEQMGIAVVRVRNWFEIAQVPKKLMDHFSKRREQIEAELDRLGVYSAKAAAAATLKTRPAKEDLVREKLFEEWQEAGREHGWSEEQAQELFGRFVDRRDHAKEIAEAIAAAKENLTKDNAHFSERDFIRALAEQAPGRGIDAPEVIEVAGRYLATSPDIVRLGTQRGTPRFTTKEMYELEKELLDCAQEMVAKESHGVRPETAMAVLSRHGELSEEQMKAVWHITVESNGLALVSGYAGTGKTHMLKVAREIWEAEGIKVVGTAIGGRAQRELGEQSGIPTMTMAKLLYDVSKGRQPVPRDSVVIVDEAGMVGTANWLLLSKVCAAVGAKICAVGHEKQLQPIGAGAPFLELGDRFGRAVLVQNRRQNAAWAKQAVRDFAEGEAKAALAEYAKRGLVSIHETRHEAMAALVDEWRQDGMNGKDSLILAGMVWEVEQLNAMAQEKMRASGRLSRQGLSLEGKHFHIGDTVMFTVTSRPRQVDNGSRGKVVGLSVLQGTVTVDLYDGRRVTVCLSDFPHLDLGYAMTTHKAQGATVDAAYLLVGGTMQHRELSYVQTSRARDTTRLFTTPSVTGDALADLAKEMARSRQKDMAISVERQQSVTQEQGGPAFER